MTNETQVPPTESETLFDALVGAVIEIHTLRTRVQQLEDGMREMIHSGVPAHPGASELDYMQVAPVLSDWPDIYIPDDDDGELYSQYEAEITAILEASNNGLDLVPGDEKWSRLEVLEHILETRDAST